MKKSLLLGIIGLSGIAMISCNGKDNSKEGSSSSELISSSENKSSSSEGEKSSSESESSSTRVNPDSSTTIFLAGDSTVKTYTDSQYIGGWGQYLDLFLDDNITVKNCAQGGRSSRSFINEGRLYDTKENNFRYTFSENGGHSIEEDIKEGDYLFIQFGHNDDATKQTAKNIATLPDRMVELGTPDGNGIYPTTAPSEKKATTYIPEDYLQSSDISSSDKEKMSSEIAKYGDNYYAYGDGTYKWYLNEYIEFARSKGATPVLVTPVSRVKFSGNTIIGGPGLHGDNFAYVQAVRQLAEETDTMLIDLFQDSKLMLETASPSFANFLMALKPNDLTGTWPIGYDTTYGDASLGYTGIEATHYNKFGAYLEAAKVAEHLLDFIESDKKYNDNKEEIKFENSVLKTPEKYVNPSNNISKTKIDALYNLFDDVDPKDPEFAYESSDKVDQMIQAAYDEFSSIDESNLSACGKAIDNINKATFSLNVDDRTKLSNMELLKELKANYDEAYKVFAPKASDTMVVKFDSITSTLTDKESISITSEKGNKFDLDIYATSEKSVTVGAATASFKYDNKDYSATNRLQLSGIPAYGTSRCIGFTLEKKSKITICCNGGTKDDGSDRELLIVSQTNTSKALGSFGAPSGVTVTTVDNIEAGSYYLGSAAKGVNVYCIIIEYLE